MKNHRALEQTIVSDIKSHSQKRACLDILLSLDGDSEERRKHNYKFNQIYQKIKTRNSLRDTIDALTYLSGSKCQFLKQLYQFIDDNGELHHIDHRSVLKATRENQFFHPETGERVEDFEKKIFIVYLINNE